MNCPFGCRVSNYPNAQRICQHHWPEKEARFVEPHPPSHLSASVQRERSRKYWIEALSCRKNCSHPVRTACVPFPEMSVTCPTSTSGTSVIALNRPVSPSKGTPRSLAFNLFFTLKLLFNRFLLKRAMIVRNEKERKRIFISSIWNVCLLKSSG